MSEELKPCPFCHDKLGIQVSLNSKGQTLERLVHPFHKDINCPLSLAVFMREQWQSRPLEDALTAERDELKKRLEIPEQIRTANWIMEKNERVFSLTAERDELKHNLDNCKILSDVHEAERDALKAKLEQAKEALENGKQLASANNDRIAWETLDSVIQKLEEN